MNQFHVAQGWPPSSHSLPWYQRAAGIILIVAMMSLAVRLQPASAQIKLATDRPKLPTPEEEAARFQIDEGFDVQAVASEPYLADPVAIDFDARGRIFVCEIHGYNQEGYYDIVELNKSGVLDTQVRRIDASREAQARAEKDQYGTVKLLEDRDGNGRIDHASVWADHLPACYGVVAAAGGVVAICPPEVRYLADRDGDGTAEVNKLLYRTGGGPMWNRPSNPRWNIDNWIYYDGGFRFLPDGSAQEPATGSGQFGHALTWWGDRFYLVQSQPVRYIAPLPHRDLARNPYHAAGNAITSLLRYNDLYPISQPDPWRRKRGADPAWLKFYGKTEATPNGYVTSACGPVIYQGGHFPAEYDGNYFFCEPAQNLIHRCLLLRDGAGFRVERASEKKVEFLASPDVWFRPVNMLVGPDGAIYVVDMCREIIEDYSAIPRFLQQQYVEGLIAGHDRGRIWRIAPKNLPRAERFDLTGAPASALVERLSGPNMWWRQTAQRLLVERGDKTPVAAIQELAAHGATPQARLHALYTLEGLAALRPEVIEPRLADENFAVRLHALRMAVPLLKQNAALERVVLGMAGDEDAKVQLQLALTLGESDKPEVLKVLAQLARLHGESAWMLDAILSSAARRCDALVAELLSRPKELGQGARLLRPLAASAGTRRDDDELGRLLMTIAEAGPDVTPEMKNQCLAGLSEGLQRGKPRVMTSTAGQAALKQLLASDSTEVKTAAIRVAGLVKLEESEALRAAMAGAVRTALDDGAALEARQQALALVALAPFAQASDVAGKLLQAQQPLPIQLATIEALGASDDPRVAGVLLAGWKSHSPKVQAAVLGALFARQNRLPGLLDAIEQGTVSGGVLDAAQRERLLRNSNTKIAARAAKLIGESASADRRAEVLARFAAALTLERNVERGAKLFEQHCSKCHKLAGVGHEVGPDLAPIRAKTDEMLLADVLDPSRSITVGYNSYTVVTDSGRVFAGVLAGETATSIVLRAEKGQEQVILRKEIDQMQASSLSLMPEDIDKQIAPQDLADLFGFLRQTLGEGPVGKGPVVVLFDDEPQFVAALTEGSGKARLATDDPFSGKACLAVTPPQRFSARVPEWAFRIAEKPGPGEFRYVQFAWRTEGEGVMIELAADGQWPQANEPLRRYYAGKNGSGWQAVEVSPAVPREWVVVSRDLWKDFGSFTLTGIAPTAFGGEARFDRIRLLRSMDDAQPQQP